jgi:hypothetical protein
MMKITRKNVKKIMSSYDCLFEESFISEEEFVFDSLQNSELLQLLTKTKIKSLHIMNEGEMDWDEPDEEFIKVVDADGNTEELSVDNADGYKG